jgi:phosphoribosyl-ATP pyrophosphohydrolase
MKKVDVNKILSELNKTILDRKKSDPKKSYVAKLLKEGSEKIGRKVTEEASEVLIAGIKESKKRIVSESADLLFHLLVLLAHKKIALRKFLLNYKSAWALAGLMKRPHALLKRKENERTTYTYSQAKIHKHCCCGYTCFYGFVCNHYT